MVEVTVGGDQSVDRNGSTEGKRTCTHLNTDQSSVFEHHSRRGFVEGGGEEEEMNTHCVKFLLFVFLLCDNLSCVKMIW